MDRKFIIFFILVFATIGVNYYTSSTIASLFYIALLITYYRSDDHPFWLAFFLITSDGIFSFFGKYETLLTVIPGLPGIEITHLFIYLTLVKAIRKEPEYRPFYNSFLVVLLIYIIFLILQGHAIGLSLNLNIQFRLLKDLTPLLLLYTVPKLFTKEDQYLDCFKYLFPVAMIALGAQFFTIFFKTSPLEYFGAKIETRTKVLINGAEVSADSLYRGIYNESILIITYFGALYCLARKTIRFNSIYLNIIVLSVFLVYLISATRGYVLGFVLIFIPYLIFITGVNVKQMIGIFALGTLMFIAILSIPVINLQISHAVARMGTMSSLVGGDITAGGTLRRLSERSPKVMKVWRESPLTGWGYSDTFYDKKDMHVANQTILMHSGIIGALLMGCFFFYFNFRLFLRSRGLPRDHTYKKALFLFGVFFLGWFAMHSSTQYYFSYYQSPAVGVIEAIFFSLGGLAYHNSFAEQS